MIGETLRRERERQKLTVKDIEEGTSIRSVYIEAIESGEYDKLPGEVYAKGFIKNYANFLRLNGENFVKEFIGEISSASVSEDEPVTEKISPVVEVPKIQEVERSRTKITELEEPNVKIRQNKSSSSSSNILVIAAVIFIAAIAGGMWYSIQPQSGEIAKADVPTEQIQKIDKPDAIETPATQNTPTAVAPVSAATPQAVNVQAKFTGDCWTRVTADGVVIYEGVVNAGQVLDWKGNEKLNVRVGNAGAVELIMNGQSMGQIGKLGEVVEKTFTR